MPLIHQDSQTITSQTSRPPTTFHAAMQEEADGPNDEAAHRHPAPLHRGRAAPGVWGGLKEVKLYFCKYVWGLSK